MTSRDSGVVAWQLGRSPRGTWRVGARCGYGFPAVIVTPSRLASGEPFPTLYWLTCPHLLEAVSRLESEGAVEEWAERLAADAAFADRMLAADAAYRSARAAESGGDDACASVGIAGQRDPLGTKCLHAHVAAALAGIDDPVGAAVLDSLSRECADGRCAAYAAGTDGPG